MALLRWDKLLQGQGFGTRKECANLVAHGRLTLGGVAVCDARESVETDALQFCVDGQPWHYRAQLYLALNKPADYECSRKPSHHPGVHSLLPAQFLARDVQAVGRLDHDTTGLLLLSDDGAFIHAQNSPRRGVPKRYLASTDTAVTDALVARLMEGVLLHDETQPLAATWCVAVAEKQLEISVTQGKYHQVKRMLAAAGNHCVNLRRIAIGGLRLDELGLAPGQWCYLDAAQLAQLRAE